MEVRVEYDYEAQESDELTIKKGDIITNVVQKLDGWWEGVFKGKKGMFPDNFVKIVNPDKPTIETKVESASNGGVTLRGPHSNPRRLKALFSYTPEQEDELRLDIGDLIEYITEVEEGWWKGKLKGRTGIFPSNFVTDFDITITNGDKDESSKVIDNAPSEKPRTPLKPPAVPDIVPAENTKKEEIQDEEPPKLPPKPVREYARCFYPYKALNEDELELKEGDIVAIISKNCEDEGWWRGEHVKQRGVSGLFPDNFVKIIPPDAFLSPTTETAPTLPSPTKLSAQGRSINARKESAGTTRPLKKETADDTDEHGGSKMIDKEVKTPLKDPSSKTGKSFTPDPSIPAVVSPVSGSPFGSSAFTSTPIPSKDKPKRNGEDESIAVEDEQEFNSVERSENLIHLTANRAKAPKRRPPSTVIKTDDGVPNGSSHSPEPSLSNETAISPEGRGMSPMSNHASLNSNNSFSSLSGISGSTAVVQDSLNNSLQSNTSGDGKKGQKKVVMPWMAELKQKQDKKKEATSPVGVPPPSPVQPQQPPAPQEKKEPMVIPQAMNRAPPLPAKPTMTENNIPNKPSPVQPGTQPRSNALIGGNKVVSGGLGGKKSPSLPNSYSAPPGGKSVVDGTPEGPIIKQQYVPYEEFAKLRDTVSLLESELDLLKKQMRLLLDREGHIV